jgi:hypothetical protein
VLDAVQQDVFAVAELALAESARELRDRVLEARGVVEDDEAPHAGALNHEMPLDAGA